MRFNKFFDRITAALFSVLFFLQTAVSFAAEESEEKPEWVLSYFLICLMIGLAVAILLRPANRSDSAFSTEELAKQKEEAMKKMLHH
jgi:preprotein translocase subunit SecG